MAILQNTTVSGSLVITGDLTARQFILSSSVTFYTESFASGSTRFGDSPDDFMRVTGSLMISSSLGGPFIVTGSTGNVGIGFTNPTSSLNINGNVSIGANLTSLMLPHGLDSNGRSLIISGTGSANPNYGVLFLANNTGNLEVETLLGGILASQVITGSKSGTNTATKTAISFFSSGSGGSVGGLGGYMTFSTRPNNAPNDIGSYERMRITNIGNVGIGTTTPNQPLHVYSTSTTTSTFFETNAANSYIGLKSTSGINYVGNVSYNMTFEAGGAERMRITSDGDLGVGTSTIYYASGGRRVLEINGSGNSFLAFKVGDVAKSYFFQTGANFIITNLAAAGGYMALENNGGEKMRITSGGEILMHSTTYNSANIGQLFGNQGQAYFTVDGGQSLFLNRLTSDGVILDFQKNTVSVGTVSTNANSLPSDFNFKKNINTLDLGLNLVTKLRSVSYNLKIDDDDAALSTGFIAQEMEQSLTELGVNKNEYYILQHKPNEDEKQSQYWLDYSKLIPVLVKSIQELKAENDSLKEILTRNNIA